MAGIQKEHIKVVLLGILLLSLAVAPVNAARLTTPVLVSPTNNQHFFHWSGSVTMAWRSVTGANGYVLEVEQNDGSGWTGLYATPTSYTLLSEHHFFPTNRDYRWRVTAHDSTHTKDPSLPSSWRTFDITTASFRLATPVLLSPVSGTNFYHVPRATTLAWQPVQGADNYGVHVQKYVAGTGWTTCWDTNTGTMINPYYDYVPGEAAQYRWRITAQDPLGWYQNSNPSSWRTFTYKA